MYKYSMYVCKTNKKAASLLSMNDLLVDTRR